MRRTFAFGAATAQGTWPVQEDGFYADPQGGVFAVSDGFGGRGAGDLAAKTALAELRAARDSAEEAALSPALRRQRAAFHSAHQGILARNASRPFSSRGGCSLLAAAVGLNGWISLTQCGACAALLVRGGRAAPLLVPQCPPREEFPLPDQALGLSPEIQPESRSFSFEGGDLLVLASGGVEWKSENFELELLSQLSVRNLGDDLSPVATRLVESCSLSAQSWNRTVLLVERV
jgi:serine/threonine protein phosphatase PrpC